MKTKFRRINFANQKVKTQWVCKNTKGLGTLGAISYDSHRSKWVFEGARGATLDTARLADIIHFMKQLENPETNNGNPY